MLCQICHKNPAEIKISHAVNEKKIQIQLCRHCAEERGLDSGLPQLLGSFVSLLLGEDFIKEKRDRLEKKCPHCGLSWDDFRETGLLGCDICYQTFESDLNAILRRIHGSNQHIGSRPRAFRHTVDEADLESMRNELQQAVAEERFERAAELRDLIRDAERELIRRSHDGILR